MTRGWVLALGCAAFLLAGCLHAPVLWSPDGRWLAFTIAVRPGEAGLPAGWLFDTNPSSGNSFGQGKPAKGGAARCYRLWATRVDTGESVLLEESRGPLTSPAWSPDGKALAFGRLVPEPDGRARFEVVLQDGPARKRVLLSRSYDELSPKASELPGVTLAWSPDGRYLAVPDIRQTLDLAIVRADNGRVLKVVDDAYLPSWSPDGTKLAFVRGSDAESLHCIDTSFGPPRHLADIGQTSQLPAWSRDSQSILIVARRRAEGPSPQVDLMRIRADNGAAEKIVALTDRDSDPDKTFLGASFSFDRDGENLFYTTDVEGLPSQISWYRPSNKEHKNFHPIDFTIRVGALAVSPTEKTLALRVGSPGYWAPPGLVDLSSEQLDFTPIVPDDSARVEWLVTLIEAARKLLRGSLPPPTVQGELAERPTWLPVPGELTLNHELVLRLRRLGRIGRALCDRPASAAPAEPATQALIDEARLFFDYLRQDYPAAFASLEALESQTSDPAQRLRLLSVRAQIALGQRQFDQAKETIDYLQAIRQGASHHIEETTDGPSLTAVSDPNHLWSLYLAQRANEYTKRSSRVNDGAEVEHNPFGNRNPDAPQFPPPGGGMAIPFAPAGRGGVLGPPVIEAIPAPEIDNVPRADGPPPRPRMRRRVR